MTKGKLIVNDGSFFLAKTISEEAPHFAKYIVNCIDASFKNGTAVIELYGGTYGYDFSLKPEGGDSSYIAEGCMVTAKEQDGKTVYGGDQARHRVV